MLSEKIIEDAGAIGYKYMRLDTVPFMSSAIKIYEKVGFKFIENTMLIRHQMQFSCSWIYRK